MRAKNRTRVKERTKAIATLHENSLLAKHHMLQSPQIDFGSVQIVDRSSAWRQRLILKSYIPCEIGTLEMNTYHYPISAITLGIFRGIKNTLETIVKLKIFLRDLVLSRMVYIDQARPR